MIAARRISPKAAGYCWFALGADSGLLPVSTELAAYDANLVALPQERVKEFQRMLAELETSRS